MSSDKTSGKKENIESIKTLKHNLSNILGFSETCINRLKNADATTINRRWNTLKDVIISTRRNRINKEIELYKRRKDIIEKVSTKVYTDTRNQLLEADKYYKVMFDLLNNSSEYSEKDKNTAITYGEKMIRLLLDIINKMKEINFGLEKI